uniref:Uncharacterized protein n=1 Tax=Anguilla anguilla TaxID=7936 RepID=A0A0E9PVL5_ANGAN
MKQTSEPLPLLLELTQRRNYTLSFLCVFTCVIIFE